MTVVDSNSGGIFFLYGMVEQEKHSYGAAILSKGEIVLTIASSGFLFVCPWWNRKNIDREVSFCCYSLNGFALFEGLDKIFEMRYVMRSSDLNSLNRPFGEKVVVFDGDFRQILLVLKLTRNMRLQHGSTEADVAKAREFSKWILKIGDGDLGGENDGETTIEISFDLLIRGGFDPIQTIFISSMKFDRQGVPNHVLKLKVNILIMVLRNIDQFAGLCNGRRLIVTRLGGHKRDDRRILSLHLHIWSSSSWDFTMVY
ncbi:hypothetical protein V2J09_017939 [Rumex salicifolius]